MFLNYVAHRTNIILLARLQVISTETVARVSRSCELSITITCVTSELSA